MANSFVNKNDTFCIFIILMIIFSTFFQSVQSVKNELTPSVVPKCVKIGDILFMDDINEKPIKNNGAYNDHIAIYIGKNKFIHSSPFDGVKIKNYNYFTKRYTNFAFAYVINSTVFTRLLAVSWTLKQLGHKYQYSKYNSIKGYDNRWYDSELIWAAYNKIGIDLDSNSWDTPKIVTIEEILDDYDTETYIIHNVPNAVKRGDIIMMDVNYYDTVWNIPGYSNDHAAIYLGHNFRDGSYFIQAGKYGVTLKTYDFYHIWSQNFTFYYVNNANVTQRENAISWAFKQLGSDYQYFFPFMKVYGMKELGLKCEDPNNKYIKTSDQFYCMELVWASYYNQGVDIDYNGWDKIYPTPPPKINIFLRIIWEKTEGLIWSPFAYVEGNDIQQSENTTLRTIKICNCYF